MQQHVDFYPLLVVTMLAVAVPVLLHRVPRVRVPIVVGEILAGIVVGRSGLDLIEEGNAWLEFLEVFGFTYLMFLSGLEIDFQLLKRGASGDGNPIRRFLSDPVWAAICSFSLTFGISLLCASWLVKLDLAKSGFVMALILSTTSLGVIMPVLKERNLTRSRLGQNILVLSVLADFATVFLISAYVIWSRTGPSPEFLLVIVLLAATFIVYRLAALSQRIPALKKLIDELSHATAQLDTRGALALAVIFIALAQVLGLEVILGAFLAGAIISFLSREETSNLRMKLNAIGYGFFIPIFFIMVGVHFNLPALFSSSRGISLVLLLLLMAFAVKMLASFVYLPLFPLRQTLALGVLTSARLSLIIAVAEIGRQLGVINDTTNAAIILVAVTTVTVSPIVFNRIIPARSEKREGVIIVGAPPQAELLAQRLIQHGEKVSVVSANPKLFRESRGRELRVILVEPGRHRRGLEQASPEKARALIIMLEDEKEALKIALEGRDRYSLESVVASLQNPQLAGPFKREGIQVIDPGFSSVIMLELMVRHPHTFGLLAELDTNRHIQDVYLTNPDLVGRDLREVRLPGDALILALVRDGEVVIPRGYTRLNAGDLLTIVGSREAVSAARGFLGS